MESTYPSLPAFSPSSANKYLLRAYYVPGLMDIAMNKIKTLCLLVSCVFISI